MIASSPLAITELLVVRRDQDQKGGLPARRCPGAPIEPRGEGEQPEVQGAEETRQADDHRESCEHVHDVHRPLLCNLSSVSATA